MQAICVYCGSRPGQRPAYAETARALGRILAERDITLIYGGGRAGLMGITADSVMENGGRAIGIIPEALLQRELGHTGLTELHVVSNMHERKKMMADLSDAFITLPGGIGTYEELFETFTWLQLGYHRKPVGLINVEGYYDGLLSFMRHAIREGFFAPEQASLLTVSTDPAELVESLALRPHEPDHWPQLRDQI